MVEHSQGDTHREAEVRKVDESKKWTKEQGDNWGKALQRVAGRTRKRKTSAKVNASLLNGLHKPLLMELHNVWQPHLPLGSGDSRAMYNFLGRDSFVSCCLASDLIISKGEVPGGVLRAVHYSSGLLCTLIS